MTDHPNTEATKDEKVDGDGFRAWYFEPSAGEWCLYAPQLDDDHPNTEATVSEVEAGRNAILDITGGGLTFGHAEEFATAALNAAYAIRLPPLYAELERLRAQIREFRQKCDPGEDLVLVTPDELAAPKGGTDAEREG